jgi:hypothetical protein
VSTGTLKPLPALCAAAALTLTVCACGADHKNTTASTPPATGSAAVSTSRPTGASTPAGRSTDRDKDNDSTGGRPYDSDDRSVLSFGKSAPPTARSAVAALVRRYYAVAAAENGTKACSMLYSVYAEALPEDYGTSPPGPAYARGATCPAVLTAVFKHFHSELVARLPHLKVSAVRVKEHQGVAVLSFDSSAEREIRVVREGHQWKALALVDNELP